MRINMDWLIGSLFVGIPLIFAWYQDKHNLKLWWIAIMVFLTVYGVLFLIDKILEFNGWELRALAAIILAQPATELYDKGKAEMFDVGMGIIVLVVYGVIRTYFRKADETNVLERKN